MKSKNYKIGEKIVCIDNFTLYSPDTKLSNIKLLEIGKVYTVSSGYYTNEELGLNEISHHLFNNNRFIKISELRKYKLEKLNEI